MTDEQPKVSRSRHVLLTAGALGIFAVLSLLAYAFKPEAEKQAPVTPPPLVRVETAARQDYAFTVESQGAVTPSREIALAAQVSGRVEAVSPQLTAGGAFAAGEVLLELEAADYELARAQARAQVAAARLRLALETAQAELARAEWEELGEGGEPTDLAWHEPQLEEARAALAAAEALAAQAELNLARTKVRAPFAGRVRSESVDLGQFVTPGQPLASIFATDYAEVRLALDDEDLASLGLDLTWPPAPGTGPAVRLSADFAGEACAWSGRIVRTEGTVDPQTRMVWAVARVDDPYGHNAPVDGPPLAAGLFVDAEISGVTAGGVIVLPRQALREGDRVLVVREASRARPAAGDPALLALTRVKTGEVRRLLGLLEQEGDPGRRRALQAELAAAQRALAGLDEGEAAPAADPETVTVTVLGFRPVRVLRRRRNEVLIGAGLEPGERVCVSRLDEATEGMEVRVYEAGEEGPGR